MPDKVVGIFSRDSDEIYKWLIEVVESPRLEARPVYVSANSSIWTTLRGCNYAVLYHSKNRTRVNVTDVTDSLYDDELRILSEELGKKNVMVVIDDLDDSSDEAKERILENQPSIKALAQAVFLISKEEKHQNGEHSFAEKKRQMKKLWKAEKTYKSDENQKPKNYNTVSVAAEDQESPRTLGPEMRAKKRSRCCCCCSIL